MNKFNYLIDTLDSAVPKYSMWSIFIPALSSRITSLIFQLHFRRERHLFTFSGIPSSPRLALISHLTLFRFPSFDARWWWWQRMVVIHTWGPVPNWRCCCCLSTKAPVVLLSIVVVVVAARNNAQIPGFSHCSRVFISLHSPHRVSVYFWYTYIVLITHPPTDVWCFIRDSSPQCVSTTLFRV